MITSPESKRVLLVVSSSYDLTEQLQSFDGVCEFVILPQTRRKEAIELIAEAVSRYSTFQACVFFLNLNQPDPFPLDEILVSPLVTQGCKMFCAAGAGFDFVDVDYLTRNSVFYANNPNAVGVRTADSTAMMIMQALRGSSGQEHSLRSGKWHDRSIVSVDARSSTLGVIGMGNIGKQTAEHMRYFGMKVIYTQRNPREDYDKSAFRTFPQLLAEADVIVVTCPLTKSTHHLVDRAAFAQMRHGVILVNTSRGAVIDEAALVDALDSGKVLRAALDVFEDETKIHQGLLSSHNLTLLPHCAALNNTLAKDAVLERFENLRAFLETGTPISPVNSF